MPLNSVDVRSLSRALNRDAVALFDEEHIVDMMRGALNDGVHHAAGHLEERGCAVADAKLRKIELEVLREQLGGKIARIAAAEIFLDGFDLRADLVQTYAHSHGLHHVYDLANISWPQMSP